MHPRKTLHRKGNKTIHIQSSTDDTKRATVAVSITVSGKKLPLMVVFKGTKSGCIAKRRIAQISQSSSLCVPRKCLDGLQCHAKMG